MSDIEIIVSKPSARDRVCMVCAVPFRRKSGANAGKCCSRKCGFILRAQIARERARPKTCDYPPAPKTCSVCSSLFISEQPAAHICSTKCRTERARRKASPESYAHRKCIVCSSGFVRTYGANVPRNFCSVACVEISARAQRHALRARKRGATIERFNYVDVMRRDKWRCQLCRVSTPKRLRGTTDSSAPELDHIMPLALGGAHASWNTQCLCRKCNGLKGATTAGQLRLAI